MSKENQKQAIPPYISYRTFFNFIEWLREGGIPNRIDRSFWGARLSGGVGNQLMIALRFLGLLKPTNEPEEELEYLVKASGEERKEVLQGILRNRYPLIFELNLASATSGQLEDAFRQFGASGDVMRKCITFFMHVAQDAGIPLSSFILSGTRKTERKVKGRATRGRKRKEEQIKQEEQSEDIFTQQQTSVLESRLHPMVVGLLKEMPEPGSVLDSGRKESLKQYFQVLLDIIYKEGAQ